MARVQNSIPLEIKEKAEWILHQQGFTPSVANTIFYIEVIQHGGLPFQPTPLKKIPTKLTLKTVRDSKKGKNIVRSVSKEEFFAKLKK